ncbi:AAA family ATPase [Oceanomicrobium pacificus]|nr:AAA family ATPase [Oceanomicrobium pacificus]
MTRVVAISGPPGAGKTALARRLAETAGATLLSFDDFETMTDLGPAAIEDWLDRGAPLDELASAPFAAAVGRARGRLVLDMPLGRADPLVGDRIDCAVWLDCPPDLALARKVAQFARDAATQPAPGFAPWLAAYLQNYERIVRPCIDMLCEKSRNTADIILDTSGSEVTSHERLTTALKIRKFL